MNEQMNYTLHVMHDLAEATWFGGHLFGIVALNTGVRAAHDQRERGAVLNQSWANFAPLSVASAATMAATWTAIRLNNAHLSRDKSVALARVHDWLTVAALVSTLTSGVLNRIIAHEDPAGRVPVEGGTTPSEQTPETAARALRAMRIAAVAELLIGGALVSTSAILEQQQMEAGLQPRTWLAAKRRQLAVKTVQTLAAAELLRRGGQLIGKSLTTLRPRPRHVPPATRFRRIATAVRDAWESDNTDVEPNRLRRLADRIGLSRAVE